MGLSELKYNWVLVLTNDLLVVIFSNHHKISFIFEKSDKLCHNVKKKKKKKREKIGVHNMLLKCLENQHKWERTNNIAKIYAGLEIKKIPSCLLATIKEKMVAKYKNAVAR